MPKIRCLYEDCIFLSKGFCTAASIELDPEDGCLTYSEDSGDFIASTFDEEEDDGFDDFEDNWEDEGFEEIDFDEEEEDF
jgi:hypothetical protein